MLLATYETTEIRHRLQTTFGSTRQNLGLYEPTAPPKMINAPDFRV
jgi:hypothetical protein